MDTIITQHSDQLRKSPAFKFILALTFFFIVWKLFITYSHVQMYPFDYISFSWGATYQLIAIFGAIWGFVAARQWGGYRSIVGRAAIAFSIGLLAQSFGQIASSVYVFRFGEIPFPSVGDFGFFGSIPCYIYGVCMLAKASGVSITVKSLLKKVIVFFVFLAIVSSSYFIFVNGQFFDWSSPVSTLLNVAYPLAQACYVALALLTLLLSHNFLGGIMKGVVVTLIIALLLQYLSDFTFLYQAVRGMYVPEGLNDGMYLLSYFMMAVSLIYLGVAYNKIKQS